MKKITNIVITILFIVCFKSFSFSQKPYSLENDKKYFIELRNNNRINIDYPIENIINELKNKNTEDKLKDIEILRRINDTKQIPILEDLLLNDVSDEVRSECALALSVWCLESYSSIPVLKKALNDTNIRVKCDAALALSSLGEKELSFQTLNNIWDYGNNPLTRGCHLGFQNIASEAAINNLRYDLNNKDTSFALSAAIHLAQLGYFNEVFPKLKNFLASKVISIRGGAIRGLTYIGDTNSLDLIKNLLNDPDKTIRYQCKNILKNYGITDSK